MQRFTGLCDFENLGEYVLYEDHLREMAVLHRLLEEMPRMRAQRNKLMRLILLTDPCVSGEVMNELTVKQWNEFIRVFPEDDDGRNPDNKSSASAQEPKEGT